jgi:hypothetical protein
VSERAHSQHAVTKFGNGLRPQSMKRCHGAIAVIQSEMVRLGTVMRCSEAMERTVCLCVWPRFIETEGACDHTCRVFKSFDSRERREVLLAVLTLIDLQMTETVLAQTAFDDVAAVARGAKLWFCLNG